MRRCEKQRKKYWHGYHKSEGAGHRIPQYCLLRSVVLHILEGLSLKQQPGHKAAHKEAMQEIKWEAYLAQPKKISMTQRTSQVWRHDDGKSEELGPNGRPEAADLNVLGSDPLTQLEEEVGPMGERLVFGRE